MPFFFFHFYHFLLVDSTIFDVDSTYTHTHLLILLYLPYSCIANVVMLISTHFANYPSHELIFPFSAPCNIDCDFW